MGKMEKKEIRTIGLAVHNMRPEAKELTKDLTKWADSQEELEIVLLDYLRDKEALKRRIDKGIQVTFSLGGDGLFAKTARQFAPYRIPVLGVDVGGLGYLNKVEGTLEACQKAVKRLLQGDYEIETRTMLKGSVFCRGNEIGSIEALNEIVLKSSKLELVEIDVSINHTFFIFYSGDGVLLSTPTGATAYSKSTGGPLITDPEKVKCFILNPLAPHALPLPPILIPEEDKITFELIKGEEVFVAGDGIEFNSAKFNPLGARFFLKMGDKVVVQKADTTAFLIKFPEIPPFQALHDKFQLIERAVLRG